MAKYKLLLPKMGESVAEATIIKWTKSPGDYIEADETVMEIATDKVDSDVPSPVPGKLIERLYNNDDVVQVGAVIAIIETDEPEESIKNNISASEYSNSGEEHSGSIDPSNAIQEAHQQVKNELDPAPVNEVKRNEEQQIFAESVPYTEQLEQKRPVQTEDSNKGSLRFYSPLVRNIAAQEGISITELEKIPGTGADGRLTKDDLLSYIQNNYQSASALQNGKTSITQAPADNSSEHKTAPLTAASPVINSEMRQPAAQVSEPVIKSPEPKPSPEKQQPVPLKPEYTENKVGSGAFVSAGDEIIEMDRMRRLIADHMVMSKHVSPHVTSFVEADVTNLVLWREKIKGSFEKREGEKITFTPIFIEAVVKAIKDMPMINISVNGTQIIKKKDINISMATALPSGNLIVPVIKKADELNLIGLTKAVNDLASRARNNKLKPDDVQGGTFTITNVGSFGNVMGTPIINQPQVAILAVGAIKKKPAVIETLQGDMIGIRHMMFLSLSYDHRVVDGALGGSFVRRVADYLENWDSEREI
ncbi:MAG: diapophytoene dehydrogenase [Mucilaginibacter sp.]|nr:diapophytoene dehydrogenase [Mucilaginibacter sp.]